MKLPLSFSPSSQEASSYGIFTGAGTEMSELPRRTRSLAAPLVTGQAAQSQLLEKDGKSKGTGSVQCLPVTVTSVCFTHTCQFSFTAPL